MSRALTHQPIEARRRTIALKRRIVAGLRARGVIVGDEVGVADVKSLCVRHLSPRGRGESTLHYFERIAADLPDATPRWQGERAAPRIIEPMARREYGPEAHLRAAELDALPRPVSMPWDGRNVRW